jgi:peroxiredoxin
VTKTLTVGDVAPDFTLRAHDGREIKLSDYRGQRVVLAFFAFAFSNT